jgi:hypothetical protein
MALSSAQFKRYAGSHSRQVGWKAKKSTAYKIRASASKKSSPKQVYKGYKAK